MKSQECPGPDSLRVQNQTSETCAMQVMPLLSDLPFLFIGRTCDFLNGMTATYLRHYIPAISSSMAIFKGYPAKAIFVIC